MHSRFLDDLRRQAAALSEEAMPLLEGKQMANTYKTSRSLRRTATQTRLVALLMDVVAWLTVVDPKHPGRRAYRLKIRLDPGEFDEVGYLEPALADLTRRILSLHARLEHLERQLDTGLPGRFKKATDGTDIGTSSFANPAYTR